MNNTKKIASRIFNFVIPPSLVIGVLAALFVFSIKIIIEKSEHYIVKLREANLFILISPLIGLAIIYLLKEYFFRNKQNEGLKEIQNTLDNNDNHLGAFKIIAHFTNGIVTVISGGSTGIEESTLVSSGAIGNTLAKQGRKFLLYKNILICSGAAAGLTALFGSPLAGLFFAFEVLRARTSIYQLTSFVVAIGSSWAISYLTGAKPLFDINVFDWNISSIPYFIVLGLLAGITSVYLTKTVLFFKRISKKITNEVLRFSIIGISIGIILLVIPDLYGNGYSSIENLLINSKVSEYNGNIIFLFLTTFLLKPIISSLTLSGGGDGGIFAPSLFLGAFLGFIMSIILNQYFNMSIDHVHLIVIGMAAVLSASINAPLTATFLLCSIIGSYGLIIPILISCITSKIVALNILSYTVYTYKE